MTSRERFLATAARLADLVLVLGGLLALAVLGMLFYLYGWSGQRQFASAFYSVVYYGVPLTAAVVLLGALKLPPLYRVNLVVAMASLVVALYGFELFAASRTTSQFARTRPVMTNLESSTDKEREAAALTERWGVEIDTRTAGEVMAVLRADGVEAVPIVTPSNHLFVTQPDGSVVSSVRIDGREVMPLGGISNRLTVLCNENGRWVDYRSDRRGFNNPDGLWEAEGLEIAALGDSFPHGYCVPAGRDFVGLIRERHPNTLNLALAGDGPLLMLATLTEYLPSLAPKLVLWFYFEGNDLDNLENERRSAVLQRYLEDGFTQPELRRQEDLDRALTAELDRLTALERERRAARESNRLASQLTNFAKLSALRQMTGLVGGEDTAAATAAALSTDAANLEAFRTVLTTARTRVERWGGQLVFVYLPDWTRYADYQVPGLAGRDDVLRIAEDVGLRVVDLEPAFAATGDPMALFPFRSPGHYNETGHRLVADEILKALRRPAADPEAR